MGASKILALMAGLAALAACQRSDQADQNIVITDNIPADADVEALPPDESSATPTDQLANGSADPGVNDLGNATNTQ